MKKIALLFVVMLSATLIFSGCYKTESCTFAEGTYSYTDEPISAIDDLIIEELSFTFTLVEEQTENINTVKSRFDGQIFTVKFLVKFAGEEEAQEYDVEFLGKKADMVNMYPVRLYLIDEEKSLDYKFIFRLWLSRFDSPKGDTKAYSIDIDCIGQEIGHITDINDLIKYDNVENIKNGNGVVKNVKFFSNEIIHLHLEK